MSRHRALSEIEGEDRDSPQVRRPLHNAAIPGQGSSV
jgi:hypothetical protein